MNGYKWCWLKKNRLVKGPWAENTTFDFLGIKKRKGKWEERRGRARARKFDYRTGTVSYHYCCHWLLLLLLLLLLLESIVISLFFFASSSYSSVPSSISVESPLLLFCPKKNLTTSPLSALLPAVKLLIKDAYLPDVFDERNYAKARNKCSRVYHGQNLGGPSVQWPF